MSKYPIVDAKDSEGCEFKAYEVRIGDSLLHVDVELAHLYRFGRDAFIEREIELFKGRSAA